MNEAACPYGREKRRKAVRSFARLRLWHALRQTASCTHKPQLRRELSFQWDSLESRILTREQRSGVITLLELATKVEWWRSWLAQALRGNKPSAAAGSQRLSLRRRQAQ